MIERTPPQNIEAEQAIIGTMILKPKSSHEVMGVLSSDDFYKESHRGIFSSIAKIINNGETPDIITISRELDRIGKLESFGGMNYLVTLSDVVPNTAAIKGYCTIVADKAKARRFITVAQDVMSRCYEGKEQADDIANILSNSFIEATKTNTSNRETAKQIVEKLEKKIIGKVKGEINPFGITSGIPALDNLTGGWQNEDLIIIAGRPGMGKTTLGMNLVTSAAKNNKKVLVFSMEMSKEKLIQREISAASGINYNSISRGLLSNTTLPMVINTGRGIAELPIVIDDSSALHYNQIRARAKHEAILNGVDLIVIDYLQLARGNSVNNKTQEVTEISGGIKALAKDLKVPVIALSQLNRSVENRTDKRPTMSDLRDSGAIEQDASVICFIYRDEVYNKEQNNPLKGISELNVAKNREGECGSVSLSFDGATSSFKAIEMP